MAQAQRITDSMTAPGVELAGLLARIHPKHAPSFSKNLHKWMNSHGRTGDTVYQASEGSKLARDYGVGAFFIGQPYNDYEDDTDFSGVLLMQVLCMGRSVVRACYAGGAPGLIEVADFWSRYEQVGRCVIDPHHVIHFRDNDHRFDHVDGGKACKWCDTPLSSR